MPGKTCRHAGHSDWRCECVCVCVWSCYCVSLIAAYGLFCSLAVGLFPTARVCELQCHAADAAMWVMISDDVQCRDFI